MNSWYRVFTHSDPAQPSVLVWLEDISEERASHERRATMRQFQIDVLQEASGEHPEKQGDERLARHKLGVCESPGNGSILDLGWTPASFCPIDHRGKIPGASINPASDTDSPRAAMIRA